MELPPIKANLINIGNSKAIIVPKALLNVYGVEDGDQIVYKIDKIIKSENKDMPSALRLHATLVLFIKNCIYYIEART